jgi:hypothetical protein
MKYYIIAYTDYKKYIHFKGKPTYGYWTRNLDHAETYKTRQIGEDIIKFQRKRMLTTYTIKVLSENELIPYLL